MQSQLVMLQIVLLSWVDENKILCYARRLILPYYHNLRGTNAHVHPGQSLFVTFRIYLLWWKFQCSTPCSVSATVHESGQWYAICCGLLCVGTSQFYHIMMTSSSGNIFPVTGPFFAGNSSFTGEFPSQRPVTQGVMFSLICQNKQLINNCDASYWRRHRARYDVIAMSSGARPTKHISIEFEIRWKFRTL